MFSCRFYTKTTLPIMIHIFPENWGPYTGKKIYAYTETTFGASVSHEICP